jgi:hypothetical protein
MKTNWGAETDVSLTSALVGSESSASRSGRLSPEEKALVPIGQETGWAPEVVWTTWRGRNEYPNAISKDQSK